MKAVNFNENHVRLRRIQAQNKRQTKMKRGITIMETIKIYKREKQKFANKILTEIMIAKLFNIKVRNQYEAL